MPDNAPLSARATAAGLATVIFLWESLLHRQLVSLSGQTTAMVVLPAAVVGLGVGAALAARIGERGLALGLRWLGPVTLLATGTLAMTHPDWVSELLPVFALPFVTAGLAAGSLLARWPSPVVYAFDLAGAAASALFLAVALPFVQEEGVAFVLVALAMLLGAARWSRALAVVLLALAPLVATVGKSPLTRLGSPYLRARIPQPVCQDCSLVASASTLAGRVDLFAEPRADRWLAYHLNHGRFLDLMRNWSPDRYLLDPRVPTPLLPDKPRIFIVGTAGEGILKSARRLGGEVAGAEVNAAVPKLLAGEFAELCGNCYDGVKLTIGDGRRTLHGLDANWDMITFLNTHTNHGGVGEATAVEYLDTMEAMKLVFDRLNPMGIANWEEPDMYVSRPALLHMLATITATLRARGIERPADHLILYRWGGFTQILARPTAWTDAERAATKAWLGQLAQVRAGVDGPFGVGSLDFLAVNAMVWPDNEVPAFAPYAKWLDDGTLPAAREAEDEAPMTDDRPFLFANVGSRRLLWDALGTWLALAAAPVALALAWGARGLKAHRAELAAGALSGAVYLGAEALLLMQGQRGLGTPNTTFVGVVAVMLLATGLVAALTKLRTAWPIPVLLALVGVGLGAATGAAEAWMPAMGGVPTLLAAALLGGAMGVPFPALLRRTGEGGATALLFAVNASAGALAVPIVTALATVYGFSTMWFILALAALPLAAMVRR